MALGEIRIDKIDDAQRTAQKYILCENCVAEAELDEWDGSSVDKYTCEQCGHTTIG